MFWPSQFVETCHYNSEYESDYNAPSEVDLNHSQASNAQATKKVKVSEDPEETGPPRNRLVANAAIFNLAEYISSKTFDEDPHHAYGKLNRSTTEPEGVFFEEGATVEDYMNQFGVFPFKSDLPVPILSPTAATPLTVLRGGDPTFDLLEKKKYAYHRLNQYKPFVGIKYAYEKGARATVDLLRKTKSCPEKMVRVPKEMVYLAEAVELDPDPSFCAEYNWYVTGGALSISSVAGRNVLFSPGSSDLSSLVATPLKRKKSSPNRFSVQKDQKCEFRSLGGQIYQIKSLEFGDEAFIVTRQQRCCQFIKCSRQSRLKIESVHESPALCNDTFTSVELNPWNCAEYMTCTNSRVVNLYDVNSECVMNIKTPKKKGLPEMAIYTNDAENWGQIMRLWQWNKSHFSLNSQDEIFFTDESSAVLIDRRTESKPTVVLDIRNNISLFNDLMPCEAITLSCSSVVDAQMLYVATTHNLFSVDLRKPNQPAQCWSHCLSSPPVFISQSCYAENRELLLLCSSWQKEIVGITNEWSSLGDEPISRVQPFLLPSANNTLLEANKLGCCLKPNLKIRLQSSRIGICCTDSKKPTVFSVNACGDVFFQSLDRIHDPARPNINLKNVMSSWSNAVEKLDRKVPSSKSKSHAVVDPLDLAQKVMACDLSQPDVSQETEMPGVRPELPFMLKQLDLFEGVENPLNSKILEQWGIYSQQDWETKKVEALGGVVESTAKIDLVSDWLAANPSQTCETPRRMTQESQDVEEFDSQIFSQDLVSASQEEYLVESSQLPEEIGQEAATDKDVLKMKLFSKYSNVGKKRRRYDGF
ncbi:Hypothetical predicted protein [Cloeon dipterum]|uniref:TATA box-binding protein-associated factor RNA polymerase I subunit C n=1 Tax=Cloeon dipterum TaxID=197152 RepID=A0A8S1D1T8_9INSE|nr:Hypothetical predicted protein [Cloeon dipterum]